MNRSHVTYPTPHLLARMSLLRAFVPRPDSSAPATPGQRRHVLRTMSAPMPRVRLALPLELVEEEMPAFDAFVLSRMGGGAIAVDDLLALCPSPHMDVLRVLDRWAEKNLIVLA